jgi:hypothetical protein
MAALVTAPQAEDTGRVSFQAYLLLLIVVGAVLDAIGPILVWATRKPRHAAVKLSGPVE